MSTQEQTQPAELVDYTTGEIRQNLSRRDKVEFGTRLMWREVTR